MARNRKPRYGFQITTPIAAVILLLIVFVSLGYFFVETIPGLPPDNSRVLQEMEERRAVWHERRPGRMRYVVDRDCDCASESNRPYIATESGRQRRAEFPVSVESDDGEQLQAPHDPVWIDDMFALISTADVQNQAVSARFHPEFGFPVEVVIRQKPDSTDTIAIYEIRDFENLDYR